MQVRELMTKSAECIGADATLHQAAERMRSLDVGALPVCDNDRLVGMLTDRDITVRSVSDGHDPRQNHVRDAMTRNIVYCFEDQDVAEAAQLMRERQVRRLPVLNRDKRLAGIVSLGDLALEGRDQRLVGEALAGISEPSKRRA